LKPWKDRYPDVVLINMFGITETTVHVTHKVIGDYEIEHNISNIGKPIPTLSTYILDRDRRLLPMGAIGELYVRRAGVCTGYLGKEELTDQKFVLNPYKSEERLYRLRRPGPPVKRGRHRIYGQDGRPGQVAGFQDRAGRDRKSVGQV